MHRHARAADVLHVAVALMSEVQRFASLDGIQAEIARTVGLQTVTF